MSETPIPEQLWTYNTNKMFENLSQPGNFLTMNFNEMMLSTKQETWEIATGNIIHEFSGKNLEMNENQAIQLVGVTGYGSPYQDWRLVTAWGCIENAAERDKVIQVNPINGKLILEKKQPGNKLQLWTLTPEGYLLSKGDSRGFVMDFNGNRNTLAGNQAICIPKRHVNMAEQQWFWRRTGEIANRWNSNFVLEPNGNMIVLAAITNATNQRWNFVPLLN